MPTDEDSARWHGGVYQAMALFDVKLYLEPFLM